jgi:DNA mismatch repair protein MutL
MSAKIQILPDEVANHIAAGEVIERPASVVKELLENALDADATHIDIEIGIGGKAYIRVTDNGSGMSKEDARLAFERHATSKITATADLASITTLGFRGEALPSIASVAKVKLLTRMADELVGTRIDIHGGDILNVTDSGSAPGTLIEVNDLFYKTPARLKFLKSPATELSYINSVIIDEALAYPQVGFTLKNNGREQFNLPGKSDLVQRVAGLFGRDLARELVEISENAGSLSLRGLIGLPSCHRANRTYQKIFVNQRAVKDKTISHAIQQAYETLIPKKRYPVAFLLLALPPQLVDVNVHPTKMEVRFINSQAIHDFVVEALRKTLRSSASKYTVASFESTPVNHHESISPPESLSPEQPDIFSFPGAITTSQAIVNLDAQDFLPTEPGHPETNIPELSPETGRLAHARTTLANIPAIPSQDFAPHTLPFRTGGFANMKPIGQFHDTYLLAQAGDDLIFIDQHAAHERIFYEKLKVQFQHANLEIQQLLFPVAIELSPREQAVLEDHLDLLQHYGLELEPFGGATYLLKTVPALLAKADHKKLLYDILDQLTEIEKTAPVEHQFDQVLILMSCHAAIRAHQPLQPAQILALLQQLDAIEYPYTCPHGRPTVLKISLRDLEKKFGRG